METKFKLGDVLKDIITGFEGVCMGITLYYTDCTHYGLSSQSLDEKGKIREWQWFDETRLENTGKVVKLNERTKPTSGVFDQPPDM